MNRWSPKLLEDLALYFEGSGELRHFLVRSSSLYHLPPKLPMNAKVEEIVDDLVDVCKRTSIEGDLVGNLLLHLEQARPPVERRLELISRLQQAIARLKLDRTDDSLATSDTDIPDIPDAVRKRADEKGEI